MTGWIIFAGIVLFITLLMLVPVGIVMSYGDDFVLRLKILFFTLGIIPARKKKINLRDYNIKRIRRRKKRAAAKATKALKKKRKSSKKTASEESDEEEKTSVIEMLRLIKSLITDLTAPLFGYMKIELERLRITVASEDAATTAMLYGAVVQGVTYLCEFLRNTTNFRMSCKDGEIAVIPDFTSNKMSVQVKLIIKFHIWQLIALALRLGISYIKNKNTGAADDAVSDNNTQKNNGGKENG